MRCEFADPSRAAPSGRVVDFMAYGGIESFTDHRTAARPPVVRTVVYDSRSLAGSDHHEADRLDDADR
jgi:hypothetical protein